MCVCPGWMSASKESKVLFTPRRALLYFLCRSTLFSVFLLSWRKCNIIATIFTEMTLWERRNDSRFTLGGVWCWMYAWFCRVLFGYIFTLLNLFLRYCMVHCNDDFLTLTFTPLQKIPAMLLHCVERVFLAKKKKVRLPHQDEKMPRLFSTFEQKKEELFVYKADFS